MNCNIMSNSFTCVCNICCHAQHLFYIKPEQMWSNIIPLDFQDMGYFYRGPIDIEIFWATG